MNLILDISVCISFKLNFNIFNIFYFRMKGKLNVAKIDMDSSPKLVDRMKITKCPSAML